jgi:hypothetical protein
MVSKERLEEHQEAEGLRDHDVQWPQAVLSGAAPVDVRWMGKGDQEQGGALLEKGVPNKRACQILLDGEQLLHALVAKAAMTEVGLTVLPNWPRYSPDLNPQENVWAWAEERLRSFETFKKSGWLPHAARIHTRVSSSVVGRSE